MILLLRSVSAAEAGWKTAQRQQKSQRREKKEKWAKESLAVDSVIADGKITFSVGYTTS
jgi:hypothetical protein